MNFEGMLNPTARDMAPSGIRKYFDMINEMKGVISLGIGEPDFVTPWNISRAGIRSIEEGHTHYAPNSGYGALRQEICKYVNRKYGLAYSPDDQTLVTVGGSEAIDLILRSIITSGDEVIVLEPYFVAYKPCVELAGGIPVIINLKAENEFKLTAEELEEKITAKTKAIILNFPNNPTGAIMTGDDLDAIVGVLKDKDIFVISDEIYAELTYEGKHVSIASYPEMYDKTILVSGFSKAFAMTGWRLGYALGNSKVIDIMFKIHQYSIMSSSSSSQYAAIDAMRNGDKEVEMMRDEYNRRRRIMHKGFNDMGLACFEPKGAFYMFPCIKSTGLTSDEFSEQLLLEEKVLVVAGDAFGTAGEGFVRATYATSMGNIIEALKRIERFSRKRQRD